MKQLLLTFILVLALSANLGAGLIEKVGPQVGKAVARVDWTDENGRAHRLSEFAGYPVILLPVYTRCQTACLTNLSHLKAALADAAADPTQFRVLLFSFDPTDTPSVLSQYRSHENVPLGWSIGTASPTNIRALLESIGYQYGQAGREFTHPNMLVLLDGKLRVAKWIYGDSYSGGDIDKALKVASGGSDWIGQHSDVLYALLLFAASICCVAFSYYLVQLILLRRAAAAAQST